MFSKTILKTLGGVFIAALGVLICIEILRWLGEVL